MVTKVITKKNYTETMFPAQDCQGSDIMTIAYPHSAQVGVVIFEHAPAPSFEVTNHASSTFTVEEAEEFDRRLRCAIKEARKMRSKLAAEANPEML